MNKPFTLLFILFAVICLSFTIKGKVISISDGDTLIVYANERKIKIRLNGIDAPEKGQDFCNPSSKHLYELCYNMDVEIDSIGLDQYKRVLGVVYVDGKNINDEMVRSGLAWRYKYNKEERYLQLQNEAKDKKLNIWSMKNPIDPYDYRKMKKKNNRKKKKGS